MLESELQKKIIKLLKKNGWITIKNISVSVSGWPDISAYKNGKAIFIEVKKTGLKPEPIQYYYLNELLTHGFDAFYIDNYNEMKIKLLNIQK